MNDDDFKKLRELIKEEIRPVKELQSVMNDKLDTHTASLIDIESKLESYADSYKINKHNIVRLDTRLSVVEEKLDINPPEDLKVPHFTD